MGIKGLVSGPIDDVYNIPPYRVLDTLWSQNIKPFTPL